MNGVIDHESDDSSQYVEVDPTGRYGRYNEILGKGASKIVYKGFDEYEGIEVAWNQVKLTDFLQRPEDLERLYSEIHLLKTLKHKNIMSFYSSWVDTTKRNINFVTEMFTSGTLRQYRLKHKKVNIRAVKHWCRQILEGLLYLHSHDPPVIHRDLKCDNIFINGNQGEVKIGDLGLAAILRKSHAARCVGTPEFMAPEVYAEEYNELVDIYSFGMCVLEMVTFEYPYSECTHPAQIYKKVISGKKPEALYKVKDPEVRIFVEKCLASVADRLSANELLQDPFLHIDDRGYDLRPINREKDFDEVDPLVQLPYQNDSSFMSGFCDYTGYEPDHEYEYQTLELAASEIDLFTSVEDDNLTNTDISIKGKRKENGDIFLRLRMNDKEGRIRNIYFPFDIETDTALSVATEMVAELDMNDHNVTRIADMIDGEIASLVPDWKKGLSVEETAESTNVNYDKDSVRNVTLADYLSLDNPGPRDILLRCSSHGSTSMRGRFEEITYQADPTDENHETDIRAQHTRRPSWGFHGSTGPHFDKVSERELHDQISCENDGRITQTPYNSPEGSVVDDNEYENEIRKEMTWLKAKYKLQLRDLRDQQSSGKSKPPNLPTKKPYNGLKRDKKLPLGSNGRGFDENDMRNALEKHFSCQFSSSDFGKREFSGYETQKLRSESCSPEHMVTAKSFYSGTLLPHSLQRVNSLPVDAVDC